MTTAEVHSSPVCLFLKCKTAICIIVGNNILMNSQPGNCVRARRGDTTHMDKTDLFEMLCAEC